MPLILSTRRRILLNYETTLADLINWPMTSITHIFDMINKNIGLLGRPSQTANGSCQPAMRVSANYIAAFGGATESTRISDANII